MPGAGAARGATTMVAKAALGLALNLEAAERRTPGTLAEARAARRSTAPLTLAPSPSMAHAPSCPAPPHVGDLAGVMKLPLLLSGRRMPGNGTNRSESQPRIPDKIKTLHVLLQRSMLPPSPPGRGS